MPFMDGYNAPSNNYFGGAVGINTMGSRVGIPTSTGKTSVASRPTPASSSRSTGRYSAPTSVPASNPGPIQPVVPDLNTFLNQDSGYQQQLRDFANALAQMNADITRRRGVLESDYGTSKKAMEDQKVKDLDNLQADYGARGILRSGLYGKAVGDYNTEFGNRMTDLGTQETRALDTLGQEQNRFQSQSDLQQQAAREAAIRRRAEQYGV